jgi:eukaryotic-like serine/threonine-protein kinase
MTVDPTQQQSLGGLARSVQMSMGAGVPPAGVPGYRLVRQLGQGAFGQVWLAVDLNTRRSVAIKFYLHRGKLNISSLSREVNHLVNMSTGRHIVQVLAVGWDASPPYYVMEYFENGSLDELSRSRGPLLASEVVSVIRELAEGLGFAHARGILHCDLKPGNVVLDHAWKPRLVDFGQGRMTNELTPSLGTLFYMAPEQADLGSTPAVTWDIYALGAITYTLLVGSPPFRSPAVLEALDTASTLPERLELYQRKIMQSSPPREHYRRPGVDKALAAIIDRCIAVDPERRFQSVQQVIDALDARQAARARRPLLLLGIVGPVLLLLLALVFSLRSISFATQESLNSVTQRSLESNRFAASYVARTLESELEALFRIVETEARKSGLREGLQTLQASKAATLSKAAGKGLEPAEIRAFQAAAERKVLDGYLEQRLDVLIAQELAGDAAAVFNSLNLTDARGTIVGIAFSSDEEKSATSPVGGNYAYRSYFNGRRIDAPVGPSSQGYPPIRNTHLSGTFRSTATGAWKIGISTPVWPPEAYDEDGELNEQEMQPLGVIVLTINLGDFELLTQRPHNNSVESHPSEELAQHSRPEELPTRFAALVDGRSGNQQGTLLQHPLIQQMDRETMKSVPMPQIKQPVIEALQRHGGVVDYRDPASEFEGGAAYAGGWIAALEPVRLPRVYPGESTSNEIGRGNSDLWILMQERSSSVAAPIRKLSSQLQRESLFELGTLLFVILVLWSIVFRTGRLRVARNGATSSRSQEEVGLQTTIDSNL